MTCLHNFLKDEEYKILNVDQIEKEFNIKDEDLVRISLYYDSFCDQYDNPDQNISFIARILNMSEKSIRKLFLKEKYDTIRKYFLTKLFIKKINVLVENNFYQMVLIDFCSLTESSFKCKIKDEDFSSEKMKETVETDLPGTVYDLLVLISLHDDKIKEFMSYFEDESKINGVFSIAKDVIVNLLTDLNKYLYNIKVQINCSSKENLEFISEVMEEQKVLLKEKEDEIEKLKEINSKLELDLKEKDSVIEDLIIDKSNKLANRKVLIIGDVSRKREYYEELKKFGLKEKNYYHIDGMKDSRNVKNNYNVDIVFNFISQAKHTASKQLESFPDNVQIIKLHSTGIAQLYEGIKQIRD